MGPPADLAVIFELPIGRRPRDDVRRAGRAVPAVRAADHGARGVPGVPKAAGGRRAPGRPRPHREAQPVGQPPGKAHRVHPLVRRPGHRDTRTSQTPVGQRGPAGGAARRPDDGGAGCLQQHAYTGRQARPPDEGQAGDRRPSGEAQRGRGWARSLLRLQLRPVPADLRLFHRAHVRRQRRTQGRFPEREPTSARR